MERLERQTGLTMDDLLAVMNHEPEQDTLAARVRYHLDIVKELHPHFAQRVETMVLEGETALGDLVEEDTRYSRSNAAMSGLITEWSNTQNTPDFPEWAYVGSMLVEYYELVKSSGMITAYQLLNPDDPRFG